VRKISIAVLGDLHLGSLVSIMPDHVDRQMSCLDATIAEIRAEKPDMVVFLGDVFDRPVPPTSIIRAWLDFLMRNSDLETHWVCGNHDRTSNLVCSIDLFDALAGTDVLPRLSVHIRPEADSTGHIGFLPYPVTRPLQGTGISFCHASFSGVVSDTGMPMEGAVPEGGHMYVAGHHHTAQAFDDVWYPGAPWPLSFDEADVHHRGRIVVDTTDGLSIEPSIEVIPPPWRMRRETIASEADLDRVAKVDDTANGTLVALKMTDPSIQLPPGYLAENPHVVRMTSTRETGISGVVKDAMGHGTMAPADPLGIRTLRRLLESEGFADDIEWAVKKVRGAV